MATLGATGLGAWLSMRGGKAAEPQQSPPLNAKSKEEENFIKYETYPTSGTQGLGTGNQSANRAGRNFVNKAEGGDKKH
jgi:F-type H+-transporting ATPase subunit k